jgi:hypothetical protein
MARDFDDVDDYLEYAGAVRTALPVTMACWIYPDLVGGDVPISLSTAGASNSISLQITVAGVLHARSSTTAAVVNAADTTATVSAATWAHVAGVFTSTTSRTAYINGANAVTDTTLNNPSAASFNTTNIGCRYEAARANFFGGAIAEAGVWSVALTAAELLSLAKGVSPLSIRPQSLVSYWPLIGRTDPEIDLHGGFGMTVSGAVAADHPKVYMPKQPFSPRKVTLAASTVPVLYRQRQMQGMAA